jgi:hypothetical protein
MSNQKEIRSLHTKEFRTSKAEDGSRTLSGVVLYNSPSVDLGGFTEILAPGCFAGSIGADVLMLRDHEPTLLMGRTKSKTLTLGDTAEGLEFNCKLPNTHSANDLAESVDRGDIDATSFGFITLEDSWVGTKEGSVVRTIISAELLEISPCSWAAYPDNAVSVRSCPPELRSKLTAPTEVPAEVRSDDSEDDDGTDDSCTCQCPECQAGDCANCSDDPCTCEGCKCNEYRAMVMKLKLAAAF